ncbi:ATP-binding protein [Glutamicibacter arilaitensis]|uniref:ATP-binding protein n=1 Tax=Glutamicibacter arilaitensis TaxID=256701 RepID=UPI003FD02065
MAKKSNKQTLKWDSAPDRAPKNIGAGSHIRTLLPNGLVISRTGAVYLTRKVPLQAIENAKSMSAKMDAMEPLFEVLDELSSLVPLGGPKMRHLMRKNYRKYEVIGVDIPKVFDPKAASLEQKTLLREQFSHAVTDRRLLLVSVQLRDKLSFDQDFKGAVDSLVESMIYAETPLQDFEDDRRRVEAIMAGAGMQVPTADEIKFADAFFNHGDHANVLRLPHGEHIHIFANEDSGLMAERAGLEDCSKWPDIPGHHALTVAGVNGFDFDFIPPEDYRSQWATALFREDALAITIRGSIEPAVVTRAELRRRRAQYISDIEERVSQNKMDKAEQESHLAQLENVESAYANDDAPATSVDTSILVVFDGVLDKTQGNVAAVTDLRIIPDLQAEALEEMLPYSPFTVNPLLQDLPVQTIAASGIQALCQVGDSSGAFIGFTESDRQPVYETGDAKVYKRMTPLILNVGKSGSGKSALMVWKAIQHGMSLTSKGTKRPQVVIDPKMGSDYSAAFEFFGAQVVSLDDIVKNDGIYDPIRFSKTTDTGVSLASTMLMSVNPWGVDKPEQYESALLSALNYGVRNGATCTGEALLKALHGQVLDNFIFSKIMAHRENSVMFQAIVGMSPISAPLNLHDGITYIRTGSQYLDLPDPNSVGANSSIEQRVCMSLVRMMVFGSMMALAHREGKVHLDESWVFLMAGQNELGMAARTARFMEVTFDLYSQTLAEVLKAELKQYICRGYLFSMEEEEAKEAFDMFGIEHSDGLFKRMSAKPTKEVGVVDDYENFVEEPNFASFRPLIRTERRKGMEKKTPVRGPLALVVDLSGKVAVTEIAIPAPVLRMIGNT